jgi:adenine deaminase
MSNIRERVDIADTVIRGGNLVNVYTKEIYPADVAIKGKMITRIGNVDEFVRDSTLVINAKGKYLTPGLIDSHLHTYESHMPITEYARAVVPHGTTAIITDFYGEGVVGGVKTIRFLLDLAKKTPLKVYFVLPTPGYYQNRPFGHTNNITRRDLTDMLDWPECHGINEAFVSEVLKNDPVMLALIERAKERRMIIYGHASEITGSKLQTWLNVVGRVADHEATTTEEAREKNQLGIWLSAREGSGCRDEVALLKAITEHGANPNYFMFCTDIASPLQLTELGHIDNNIRVAIRNGIDPVVAVQIATINAAQYMRVDEYIGSISPGKFADILVVDDLSRFEVTTVISNGQIVARNGKFAYKLEFVEYPKYMLNTIRIPESLKPDDFKIKCLRDKGEVKVRVIGVKNGTIITDELQFKMNIHDGELLPNVEKDLLKIVAIERHLNSGKIGKGFVHGFKLKSGAIGTTYSSQRQDIIIVGTNDKDIALAVNRLKENGGGFVVVQSGKVIAELELPILGLLSNEEFDTIVKKLSKVYKTIKELGCELEYPIHNLAFTALPTTIGNLKITYMGLVRVWEEKIVDLVI